MVGQNGHHVERDNSQKTQMPQGKCCDTGHDERISFGFVESPQRKKYIANHAENKAGDDSGLECALANASVHAFLANS